MRKSVQSKITRECAMTSVVVFVFCLIFILQLTTTGNLQTVITPFSKILTVEFSSMSYRASLEALQVIIIADTLTLYRYSVVMTSSCIQAEIARLKSEHKGALKLAKGSPFPITLTWPKIEPPESAAHVDVSSVGLALELGPDILPIGDDDGRAQAQEGVQINRGGLTCQLISEELPAQLRRAMEARLDRAWAEERAALNHTVSHRRCVPHMRGSPLA